MCHLLAVMDHHGFELVASVDQNIGSDNVGECKWLNLHVAISDVRVQIERREC